MDTTNAAYAADASPRRCSRFAFAFVVVTLAACAEGGLPVVDEGRYIELATDRDDPICLGTVAYMDDFMERVAGLLDESLPNAAFVRYEWRDESDESGTNHARRAGDHTTIDADQMMHEHELVHAVHQEVWPVTRPFLREGLAVMLDGENLRTQSPWPASIALDTILEANTMTYAEYDTAWFLVSQIVTDHGVSGLKGLWRDVDADADAEAVRDAYATRFGQPLETLLQPRMLPDGTQEERRACYWTVCAEPTPFENELWRASGPLGCEDDPDTLGPTTITGLGPVWRYSVVELQADTRYRYTTYGGVQVEMHPCGWHCEPLVAHQVKLDADAAMEPSLPPGRWRVNVGRPYEELPADPVGGLEIRRID